MSKLARRPRANLRAVQKCQKRCYDRLVKVQTDWLRARVWIFLPSHDLHKYKGCAIAVNFRVGLEEEDEET